MTEESDSTAVCGVWSTGTSVDFDGMSETVCWLCGMLCTVGWSSWWAADPVSAEGNGWSDCVTVDTVSIWSGADDSGSDGVDWCHSMSTVDYHGGGLAGAEMSVVVSLESCDVTEEATEFHSS